jgi:hypothetical protein
MAPAHAQVCQESTATSINGAASMSCDMRYRDAQITCDTKNPGDVAGTRPSCPKKPMPMIETPQLSYLADYTEYLYIYPKDGDDPTKPYAGTYALGTQGDTTRTFQLFGNSAPGTRRMSACTTQIRTPSDPANNREWAKLIRLQIDNCTSQYILHRALSPLQKEMPNRPLSLDDPTNPQKKVSLQSECQPLRTFRDTQNEYSATTYIEAAWRKTMIDASYRKSTTGVVKCVSCLVRDTAKAFGTSEAMTPPCDHEPHLPCGVTLDNPIQPPSPLDEVTLSQISSVQYEEIVDPTHPFSPRWDYRLSDRDYSNPALRWLSGGGGQMATAAAVYGLLQTYMESNKEKNTIFCAGVKKADKENDKKKKADLEVHVDVLEFRRGPFESALKKRVIYNNICYYWEANFTSGSDAFFYVAPLSFCWQITGFSWVYPWIYAMDFDCWECFGLDGKVDDEKSTDAQDTKKHQHPPCTTNYLGKDLKMKLGFMSGPGGLNGFRNRARCGTPMDQICRDLRKPFTPLNKLKMRYHNPEDKNDSDNKNMVLKSDMNINGFGIKDGALEGMTFREYFGNHMPYPKIWDLGQSLQKYQTSDGNDQPPLDTTGQFTAVVGVGREAAADVASQNAPKDADGKTRAELFPDQRCRTMGWGGVTADLIGLAMGRDYRRGFSSFAGVTVYWPDPMTSWTEMKLYQTRTERNVGLSCIGRYEKVFKPGSAENMVLLATGAEWQKMIVTKCAKDVKGRTKNCTFMTLKEYVDAGEPKNDDTTIYLKQLQNDAWPNAWRGYAAPLNLDAKFPIFGDGIFIPYRGLNVSEPGDVVMLPFGHEHGLAIPGVQTIGLAKLALVIETRLPAETNCNDDDQKNCYIKVLEPDNGKWPDVCGTTDTWGEMKTRYYFKPGHLPIEATEEYTRINSTKNCKETKLSHCEMSAWDELILYRIRDDQRNGCEKKEKAADCKKDE